jgi:outer membrane PBP1 activator LpoA protein
LNNPTTTEYPSAKLMSITDIIDEAVKEVLTAADNSTPVKASAARICALVAAMTTKEIRTAQALLAQLPPASGTTPTH